MAVSFGCVIDTGEYGVVQDIERENTAEVATYADADGDVAGYQSYDEGETISMTFVTDGTTGPTAGGDMTIDSNKYVVESVKEIESNSDFKRFEISGRRWVTNTIPA